MFHIKAAVIILNSPRVCLTEMINNKYHNIHHSFIICQFHYFVAALHMSCFTYNVLPLKILQMSLVTTGQSMTILGNLHLNHVPHCMLMTPIYMLQSVTQAMHVQGKQVVSFSMDANNCLSFRAADTSSSSHCKRNLESLASLRPCTFRIPLVSTS